MMIRLLLLLSFLSIGLFSTAQKKNKLKPLDSIVVDLKADAGKINSYFGDQKLYWELDPSDLDKDYLMVTRLAQIPSNYSAYVNAGSKTAERVVRWTKVDGEIILRQQSFINQANDEDPIRISVEENNYAPILAIFPILNEEKDRYLIDVSDYFNNNSPGFNIISSGAKEQFKIGGVDKKRSRIEKVSSFPQNTEVVHTLTFSVQKPPRSNRAKTFSFQVNHSLILLPENPMQIRYSDERVGWFGLEKYNYSSEALKSDSFRIIRRWRLEPKDPAAYAQGELVEPKKPIVYYLDPATPMKWRKYFKQGIEDWNQAFETAGFKNAIQAKDAPSPEEDPEFNPEDVRYSTVRYVASTTRNAIGPSVSDPRTGEILESDIIWYHNHLRSYRNRYLLETAAANPKARTLNTPEEEIGEMMRQVIAHEIGHALGLPHNMKASSAYAVDSLRSGSFTQKYGIATTLMDYARYNYVAQPGDKNIRFVRQLGPYDHYAINWGYRYYHQQSPAEIRDLLAAEVDEKSTDPIYMFGSGGLDPQAQTENIGDDPVKANTYGLSNLKIVAQNLEQWTTPTGNNFDDLKELHQEMLGVYRRYINHVARIVGGVHETLLRQGQEGIPYRHVDRAQQIRALNFLNEELWETPTWLFDKNTLSKFDPYKGVEQVQNLQKSVLNRLLSTKTLNRMWRTQSSLSGTPLGVQQLLTTLNKHLFFERCSPTIHEQHLQLYALEKLNTLSTDDALDPSLRAVITDRKGELRKWFKRNKRGDLGTHYRYALELLETN
ncbi:MAG: zinc-dependent metalloprotease [Flavobacteriaceae bacterium]